MADYDGSVRIAVIMDDSEAQTGIGKLEGKVSQMAKAAAAAIGAASVAVIGFGKASISTGAAFDSSMSQVAATMGTTTDQIGELRDFAMEMGANTAFSAQQAADALNYMALAGYDAEQSMEVLPNVLNLAAAGGIELAAASDMVTDAQSALGLSMEESAELVDKMAMASSKSNTSVAQLGEAILTIGGTAKNLAGGTTELSTALGILADNGIKGAEGGTALRNIVLSLSAPTDTAAKAMKNLGVEVFDTNGNMRPLNETFGDLEKALSTMTQGKQTQVLSDIFNKVDLKSVNALLANTGDRFDELSGYIDNAAGAAADMADTQLDNLAGDVTLFKSALEGAQIVVSDQLTPTIREFVQFGSEGVSALATAFQEGGLSGAMKAVGPLISDLIAMISGMLPDVIAAGGQLLGALVEGLIENLPLLVEGAAQIIVTLADGIAGSLPELIPTIVDVVFQIVETLIDNVDMLVDASIEIIVALADGLINALPKLIEKAPVIIDKFLNAILDNTPKLLRAGIDLIVKLAAGIIGNIPEVIATVPKIIAAIVGAYADYFSDIVNIGKNIVKGVYQGILNMASWFKSKVKDFFSGIVDSVKGVLGIHSPSKVFAGIGKYMMQGLSDGLDSGARLAVRSARAATLAVENAATPNVQFGTHYFPQLSSVRLPALATGAVIPPNREFMAVLGDQTSGTNVEAPLDTIKQALLEAMREAGGFGGGDINITVELDGKVVARNTVKHINDMTMRAGKPVLKI